MELKRISGKNNKSIIDLSLEEREGDTCTLGLAVCCIGFRLQ